MKPSKRLVAALVGCTAVVSISVAYNIWWES